MSTRSDNDPRSKVPDRARHKPDIYPRAPVCGKLGFDEISIRDELFAVSRHSTGTGTAALKPGVSGVALGLIIRQSIYLKIL